MSGGSRIYNIITLLFLLLSVAACVMVILALSGPPAADPNAAIDAASLPTFQVLPTLTASATLTPTDLPTFTPTATQTLVPSITPPPSATTVPSATPVPPTATFTLAPSATITQTPGPTSTSTATPTATNTDVPTPAPSPTGPTPSPFPFDVRGNGPNYTVNFANTAGCAWQGIGGQVFDVNEQPLNNIQVHVYGNNFNQFTISGSNTLYGAGGWEISVGTQISTTSFIVELLSPQGTIISPSVTVTFPGDCSRNLAVVNFKQTRPF